MTYQADTPAKSRASIADPKISSIIAINSEIIFKNECPVGYTNRCFKAKRKIVIIVRKLFIYGLGIYEPMRILQLTIAFIVVVLAVIYTPSNEAADITEQKLIFIGDAFLIYISVFVAIRIYLDELNRRTERKSFGKRQWKHWIFEYVK